MPAIKVPSGNVYECNWISSIVSPRELWINLEYSGRIPEVAADFDGLKSIEYDGKEYVGYSMITNLMLDDKKATIILRSE